MQIRVVCIDYPYLYKYIYLYYLEDFLIIPEVHDV